MKRQAMVRDGAGWCPAPDEYGAGFLAEAYRVWCAGGGCRFGVPESEGLHTHLVRSWLHDDMSGQEERAMYAMWADEEDDACYRGMFRRLAMTRRERLERAARLWWPAWALTGIASAVVGALWWWL